MTTGEASIQRQGEVLHELIRDRVDQRYGVFDVTGEGRKLPDGSEESSGFVITAEDRVFFFRLGWDHVNGRPTLTTWEEDELDPEWDDVEYRRARKAAGLSPT